MRGEMVKQLKEKRFRTGLEKRFGRATKVTLKQSRQRTMRFPRCFVHGPQDMWTAFHLGIERQQESVVVRGGAKAVNKLWEKAHHDHARLEAGEIHDVMELHVVHHQN